MRRKVVAVWVSLLIMVSSIVILVEIAERVEAPTTLYVGGAGGGNYSKIQWAIDNASTGDTVFVYNGTYYENVVVNKTINLIGNERYQTIINGSGIGDVVIITADFVYMTNFTIKGGGGSFGDSGLDLANLKNTTITRCNVLDHLYFGINLHTTSAVKLINISVSNCSDSGINIAYSSDTIISNSTLSYNGDYGLHISSSSGTKLIYNNISNNAISGAYMIHSPENLIEYNNIANNDFRGLHLLNISNSIISENRFLGQGWHAVALHGGHDNVISHNFMYENEDGVYCEVSDNNIIIYNEILKNTWIGIELVGSEYNNITRNNIVQNENSGIIINDFMSISGNNNSVTNNNVILNDWVGIHMYDSNNNTISKNNLLENDEAIRFSRAANNSINSNFVMDNNHGISLLESTSNYITFNTFINNNYTLSISNSRWNHIYMNNIINGKKRQVNSFDTSSYDNIWNNTDGRGNYWEDYTGNDNGSDGRVAGDGIGDTEIPHPSINKGNGYYHLDIYPLINKVFNFTYLYKGWNLISIPLIQSQTTLARVLSTINGTYKAVQWFNTTDLADPWKHSCPLKLSHLNDFEEINQTIGFWIFIMNPNGVLLEYPGTQPTSNQTIQLHPGWNMVGYPSLSNQNRTIGLNNLEFGTDVDAIQWYDAASKTWHFMGPDDVFTPGRGYWVHSKVEAGWEVLI